MLAAGRSSSCRLRGGRHRVGCGEVVVVSAAGRSSSCWLRGGRRRVGCGEVIVV